MTWAVILFFTVFGKPGTTAYVFQVERWLSWSKALDSKSNVGFKTHRGFESHSLRQFFNKSSVLCRGFYFGKENRPEIWMNGCLVVKGVFLTGIFKAISIRMIVTIIIFMGRLGRFTNDYMIQKANA